MLSELDTIYKLDLSKNKSLDNVRDWLLIGAYTGLRFSDLERLSKDNINDNIVEIRANEAIQKIIVKLYEFNNTYYSMVYILFE